MTLHGIKNIIYLSFWCKSYGYTIVEYVASFTKITGENIHVQCYELFKSKQLFLYAKIPRLSGPHIHMYLKCYFKFANHQRNIYMNFKMLNSQSFWRTFNILKIDNVFWQGKDNKPSRWEGDSHLRWFR